MRDIGGWPSSGGGRVRHGLYFRGDDWSRLTPGDLDTVAALGIGMVVDLRSSSEIRSARDRLPDPRPRWLHLPAFAGNPAGGGLGFLLRHHGRFDSWLMDGYRRIVVERSGFFRDLFRLLAAGGDCPVFVHCSAGKDRTGLATALLLSVLGVSDDDVMDEYLLTNRAAPVWLEDYGPTLRWLRLIGIGAQEFAPLLEARPDYLRGALNLVKDGWGGAEGYLLGAGVKPGELAALRSKFLQ